MTSATHVVERMLGAMPHRGPDGAGLVEFDEGALGMVRLALVDLSSAGQQPFVSPDGLVAMVFNGEMYNFKPHRARLAKAGYVFTSSSDAEVALALYLEQDEDFVHAMRGMFALALVDRRRGRERVLIARDPLGIKPLLVHRTSEGHIVFASELRSLRASRIVEDNIDREGLRGFLDHGFTLQPDSMLAGVEMVPAGTYWVWGDGPRRDVKYWRLPAEGGGLASRTAAKKRVRDVMEESVALHAWADADVGLFLSGGVDSTVVAALMRPHVPELYAYTLRFPDVPGADEVSAATDAAQALSCRHVAVDVTGEDMAQALPEICTALDQPSHDGFNTWFISKRASQDVKGVLSGIGGDEWFGGYDVTRRMAYYQNTRRGRAHAQAASAAHRLAPLLPPGRTTERLNNYAARRAAIALWNGPHQMFQPQAADTLLGDDRDGDGLRGLRRTLSAEGIDLDTETVVGLGLALDVTTFLRSQLLRDADACSMWHSLELRTPLVDVEVARLGRALADDLKMKRDGGASSRYGDSGAKRILIDAVADILPIDFSKREKLGFVLPIHHWIENSGLRERVADATSSASIRARGWLSELAVASLRERQAKGDATVLPLLWGLTVLEWWARGVLDAGPSGAVHIDRRVRVGSASEATRV